MRYCAATILYGLENAGQGHNDYFGSIAFITNSCILVSTRI